jgi:hypothetical protein
MSMRTPGGGDDNPFASARVMRTMLLMCLFFGAFFALGQVIHVIPGVHSGLEALLTRYFSDRNGAAGGGSGGGGGGTIGAGGGKKALAELRDFQEQARRKLLTGGGPMTPAEAKAAVGVLVQLRKSIDALPPEQREAARQERDKLGRELRAARVKSYFNASAKDRRAELDRQIKQERLLRQAGKASGLKADELPGCLIESGEAAGPGGAGAANEADRNSLLKGYIDHTSPEQRARDAEYARAFEARRQQLRLPD